MDTMELEALPTRCAMRGSRADKLFRRAQIEVKFVLSIQLPGENLSLVIGKANKHQKQISW